MSAESGHTSHARIEAMPDEEIKSDNPGMETKIGCASKQTGKAIVTHLYVKFKENRKPNSYGEALCDNAYEIVNSFVHEKDHISKAIKMGYYKWAELISTDAGRCSVERSAIAAQRSHSSWSGCRIGYKKGIDNYEKRH